MECKTNCKGCETHKEACPECEGKGYYIVYNAYDDKVKEKTTCEYCGGSGEKNPYLRSVSLEELATEGLAWEGPIAEC